MPGTLYIVATPIGNLSDMTPRGVQVLSDVDMIAAEDTRHSRNLLTHFGIQTPTFSCHKFNEGKRGGFFVAALREGKNVALISDAGTPCISDPGHRLVSLAAEAGVEVVAVCGANAVAAALSVSGFDASQFVFLGFLPRTKKEQDEIFAAAGKHLIGPGFHPQPHIRKVKEGAPTLPELPMTYPVVFYESPLRIDKTLSWLAETHPAAKICLCNDLTKKFERVYRGTPATVLEELLENPNAKKGEYTCVVSLPVAESKEANEAGPPISLEARLLDIMIKHNCTLKEAANLLHETQQSQQQTQRKQGSKKNIYAATLRLKGLFTS